MWPNEYHETSCNLRKSDHGLLSVAASLQAPTLFTIAKDLTQMQVDTNVSEADVGRVTVGQDATFTVDALMDRILTNNKLQYNNCSALSFPEGLKCQ